jgi:drug/metabolite transporter (DMT)-like permease
MKPSTGDLLLLAAAFFAGTGWIFSVKALEELPPLLFIGSRFLLGGLLIGLAIGPSTIRMASFRNRYLSLSALAMAGAMIGWIIGLKHTTHVGVAAFITASGNLIVPFVGFALFRWPIRRGFLLSIGMASLGLGLLFLDNRSGFEPAQYLFLGSAALWALSVALVKQAVRDVRSTEIAVVQLCVTGLLVLGAAICFEGAPSELPSSVAFGWFAASVLLSTCLRFILQFEGQRASTPTKAALLMVFEPVWAMLFAFLLFSAPVTEMQALGCAVIFAAVAWDAFRRSSPG